MDRRPRISRQRRQLLRRRYRRACGEVWWVERTATPDEDDAHPRIAEAGNRAGQRLHHGIPRPAGGDHAGSNPHDLLCTVLAACQESILREPAVRFGMGLKSLAVEATVEVDVRGTCYGHPAVEAGVQRITCRVHLKVAEGTGPAVVEKLCFAAERRCVALQALRRAAKVSVQFDIDGHMPAPQRAAR